MTGAVRLAAVASALGCGGLDARSAAQADADADAGGERLGALLFHPGESMEWEVSWFGVTVGRVQLAVGQEGEMEGRRALVVRSVARSEGALAMVREGAIELTTWIDLEAERPLAQEGAFDEIYRGELLGARHGAAVWPRTPWTSMLPGGVSAQSSHTALGALRGWTPEVGARAHLYVRLRQRLVRLDLVAAGRERVASPLGRVWARRIDGVATPVGADLEPVAGGTPLALAVWVDEGEERAPVRIAAEVGMGGPVEFRLVAYDRARR